MKKQILITIMAALMVVTGMVGCKSGGGGGGTVVIIDDVYTGWYNVFGEQCGDLAEGCAWVDDYSDLKAMWEDDPYFDPWLDGIWATVYDDELGLWVDAYGFYGWNGVFYDYYTSRAINEGNTSKSRDLIGSVGKKRDDLVETIGKSFAAKYSLDEEVGIRVARTMQEFNEIATSRSRTAEDLRDFSPRLLGVNMESVMDAAVSGDQAKKDAVLEAAASNWKTSPENMKQILGDVFEIQDML